MGGPGYSISGDYASNGYRENNLKHVRGVLSMARSMMPNSAGSQFFVMHSDAPHLDGDYAAFGMVTEGMDTVDDIATTPTGLRDRPVQEQRLRRVTVETFGETYDVVKYGQE
jgi:peptidyl-prolyl cis-trans isomerase B (cyclophilin B)